MVCMVDETDHLLDAFLDAASGERTVQTRERYQRTLAHLRAPGPAEDGCGPGVRLLLRVSDCLSRADAASALDDGMRADEVDTMPSLCERLVTWLRRHSDAGDDAAGGALAQARVALREARERRSRWRYPAARQSRWDDLPSGYGDPMAEPRADHHDDPWYVGVPRWDDGVYRPDLYALWPRD